MITLACYSDKVNDINFENMTNDDDATQGNSAASQWNSLRSKAGKGSGSL